jgi:kojibiose phosphorylase
MRQIYNKYTADDLWLIKETEWVSSLQNIRETQFALGNGYFATRAVLEEIPYDAMPGTYIAGIYDKLTAQVAELVNLPNPFNFRFTTNGEKLDVVAMDVLKHRRILNMKKGILVRHTLYQDSKKNRYDYQSLRFVSMHEKNFGVMQVILTALDKDCDIDVNTGIDTSVYNAGILTEGRKRHFRLVELGQYRNAGYLVIETFERKYRVIYWSGFYYEIDDRKTFAKTNIFKLKLKKNQSIVFTKIFYIGNFSVDNKVSQYKERAFRKFYSIFHAKFSDILKSHINAWEKLWKKADILIEGTANLQQNLRFNIYHMLISGNYDEGFSSIGARTLTGEGYRGHVFWDTEIFLMPFYLFVFPKVAKNMLLYRYRRLEKARELAKEKGYKGAMFPWESADTGEEETPGWSKDLDGSVIKIHTHEMEHHITADIAYAVYRYFLATRDDEFMKKCGYEILLETARFWASRVQYNKRKEKFEIRHVIGPDEFHINVDNNAYTNMMAKWNLLTAYRFYFKMKRNLSSLYNTLKRKLNLKDKEVKNWRNISSRLTVNIDKNRVIEQFDGYFKLKYIELIETDENGIPLIPKGLRPKNLGKTQLIKQADVLMLLYLLSDIFNIITKKANYEFYIKRTLHKSSLSPSIHSIVACQCQDLNRAYNLFNVSLRDDISNLYNNTKEGIHAASLGGIWQAVVFGFAGISIKKEVLFINPLMPRTWKKLIFSLNWRNNLLKLELTNEIIKLKIISRKNKSVKIGMFNEVHLLKTNKTHIFKRKIKPKISEYYY